MVIKIGSWRTFCDRAGAIQREVSARWAQVFDTGAWMIFEDGELRFEVESDNSAGRACALRHSDEIDAFVRSY